MGIKVYSLLWVLQDFLSTTVCTYIVECRSSTVGITVMIKASIPLITVHRTILGVRFAHQLSLPFSVSCEDDSFGSPNFATPEPSPF